MRLGLLLLRVDLRVELALAVERFLLVEVERFLLVVVRFLALGVERFLLDVVRFLALGVERFLLEVRLVERFLLLELVVERFLVVVEGRRRLGLLFLLDFFELLFLVELVFELNCDAKNLRQKVMKLFWLPACF